MLFTVDGIVLRERCFGESNKFIDVLTVKHGVISISVHGASKINSKSSSSCQLFAFSRFCINENKGAYYLQSAEPKQIFYSLRMDLDKLSLASYFADVVIYSVESQEQKNEAVRLLLNTLYMMSETDKSLELLKSIFELRFVSEIGLMPNIVGCSECSEYVAEKMYFSIEEGKLYCGDCYAKSGQQDAVSLTPSVLQAIRHIVLSEMDKLFAFKISQLSQNKLSFITEQYLLTHIGRNFKTLDFYKTICVNNS